MKKWIIIAVIILILIGIRIALPFFIVNYVNKTLDGLENYEGSISDVDLSLFRGAYEIDSIRILKKEDSVPEPFVFIEKVDLSIHWSALFKGKIVGEISLQNPVLNFVVTQTGAKQDGTGENWTKPVKNLMPIRVNRFEIDNGRITYKDYSTNPKVDVFIDSLNMLATNLSNVERKDDKFPSSISASGSTIGGGHITLNTKADLLKQIPDFDLNFKLENMKLKSVNDFMKAYTKTDVERGIFSLYIELLLENRKFTGYLKPVFENLKFVDWGEKEDANKIWESIVGFFAEIFENQPKDQVASRIPLEGNLNDADVGIFAAIWNLLRNAFVESLNKNLDFSIDTSTPLNGSGSEKNKENKEKKENNKD